MVSVAAVAGLVDWRVGARAWMPNVVVGALSVAITVTVVERAIHSEERRREQPLAQRGLAAMGIALRGFTRTVIHDYGATHSASVDAVPSTILELLDLWLAGQAAEDLPRGVRKAGQLPDLVAHAGGLIERLLALSGQYELVLATRPDLLNQIHIAAEMVAQAAGSFQVIDRGAASDPLQAEQKALALAVVAAKGVAVSLSEYCEDWVLRIPPGQPQAWYEQSRAEL